jgi:hypothetical protein
LNTSAENSHTSGKQNSSVTEELLGIRAERKTEKLSIFIIKMIIGCLLNDISFHLAMGRVLLIVLVEL